MPIHIELIRDKSAVLQTYTDPLNSTDLIASSQKMIHDIFPSTTGKLHIITDFRGVKNLPSTILRAGSTMMRTAHSNTGHIICVTESTFVAMMANIFGKVSPK